MNSYGFADGNGNSITRGRQSTEREAHRFAQSYANEHKICVEYWIEGDKSVDGEPAESLETVWPE
jgi:hypothetical protein